MTKKNIKLIMELIFIFIIPLLFICFTSEIQVERNFEYDNNGNYETSADTKKLSFDNSIIKYTDGYKNTINNFNLWNEEWEIGYLADNGTLGNPSNAIHSIDYISITPGTIYYICLLSNSTSSLKFITYDQNKNVLGNVWVQNQTYSFGNNVYYLKVTTDYAYGTTYNNNICINESVSWANGNYIPYDKPLILYTQTDVSGQNDINYTIWGNIKQLLIDNLKLNDNVLLDIVLCYMILWIINWIIWHLFYEFLELIIHIIPRKWERE